MILCKHGLFLEIRLQIDVCNGDVSLSYGLNS
jgi:hypothetical protein